LKPYKKCINWYENHWKENKLYKKRVKVSSKIFVHDQDNKCIVGDQVLITMCRPMSKNKAFTLVDVINKN